MNKDQKRASPLTQARLQELMTYDPETGIFTRIKPAGPKKAGSTVGWLDVDHGYMRCSVDHVIYQQHRLAWLYMTGEWPPAQIDHIDRNRSNNRWSNLRCVTSQQNAFNRGNPRGYRYVPSKPTKPYQVYVKVNGKSIYISSHKCPLLAHLAYLDAKEELHKI